MGTEHTDPLAKNCLIFDLQRQTKTFTLIVLAAEAGVDAARLLVVFELGVE